MTKHSSTIVYALCVSFVLACIFSLSCEAHDENQKLHIVYMGSLPKTPSYSPTSHHLSMLQRVFDSSDTTNSLVHSYKRTFNGFAAMLSDQQRDKLAKMEGVISVFPSKTLQKHTTGSWDFMGFPQSVKRSPTIESDIVIGVIDSGIWPESESFNDLGFGPIPPKWKGTCAGGKNFTCNKKIIGARYYETESAIDTDGHGSHTASTAAGNQVKDMSFYGLAQGIGRGGVPSARVAAYKACFQKCTEASVLAAFDDAIADGVDIISISLGLHYAANFEEDAVAIGSFHAMGKGVLTVNSAGNEGPEPSSVTSVAPWILTVAASTTDRDFIAKLVLGNGKTFTGKAINTFSSKKVPIATLFSGSLSESVKGNLALCGYYDCEDGAFFQGAIGVIKGRKNSEGYITAVTTVPSVQLNSNDYDSVESYKNTTRDPTGEMLKSETVKNDVAPFVAVFSSRGPNIKVPEILKPDITAPGVEILAAYSPFGSPSGRPADKRSVKYTIISGTSMSCPHVSGIAAYVKTFHLDWSPAAIKSAIMTSAKPMNGSKSNDQIGEYAYGSGHVNPVQAVDPGLVYDIHKEDYVQMLCNLGYENKTIQIISGENYTLCSEAPNRSSVRNLNYPALVAQVEPMTSFSVVFNRTVTNVGLATSNYTATVLPNPRMNVKVEPQILSFKSLNENKSFVVSIIGGKLPEGDVLISSLVWSDGIHDVRSPIVVNVSS